MVQANIILEYKLKQIPEGKTKRIVGPQNLHFLRGTGLLVRKKRIFYHKNANLKVNLLLELKTYLNN